MTRARRTHSHGVTKIAQRRMALDLEQSELAEASGVSLPTLRRLEQGRTRNPGIRQLSALVSALRCTLDDLIEDACTLDEPFYPYVKREKALKRIEGKWKKSSGAPLTRRPAGVGGVGRPRPRRAGAAAAPADLAATPPLLGSRRSPAVGSSHDGR